MTIEATLWMQNVDYPARLDRALISAMYDEGTLDLVSFATTERATGANFSVDVSAGNAIVAGDDEPNQGNYYAASTSVENVTVSAAPGANSRMDLLVLRVNDQNAGGAATNDMTLEVIAGVAAASPVLPALPDSAIALASIGPITSVTVSITDSLITDLRTLAGRRDAPGTLVWRADNVVPSGWLLADGSLHNVADYPALGAQLGATYGGDGTVTFGVPDGRGRVMVGPGGNIAGNAGDKGGNDTHTLTINEMPEHQHSMNQHTHTAPTHSHTVGSHNHTANHTHGTKFTSADTHQHDVARPDGTGGVAQYAGAGSGQLMYAVGNYSTTSSRLKTTDDSHQHSVSIPNLNVTTSAAGSGNTGTSSGSTGLGGDLATSDTGSSNAHSIVQPYAVVGGLLIRT